MNKFYRKSLIEKIKTLEEIRDKEICDGDCYVRSFGLCWECECRQQLSEINDILSEFWRLSNLIVKDE